MKPIVLSMAAVLTTTLAVLADGNEARTKFLESRGATFRGDAVASDAVEDKYDFERAKGEAEWKIAMPVDDDDRVRFLDAVIRNGKFVRGKLYTFGYQEEKITPARFARLREHTMMIARRGGSIRVVKRNGKELPQELTVHAPTKRAMKYKAPPHPDSISIDPCGRLIRYSRGVFDRISVNLKTLKYSVRLEGPDGIRVELGIADASGGFKQQAVADKIRRAIELKHPDRVGAVSDRDVADFYGASMVICTGVRP